MDIIDRAPVPRKIESVTSSDPGRVSVRLLPLPDKSAAGGNDAAGGSVIGRVEVSVDTSTPGDIDARIEVRLKDHPQALPTVILVAGRVVPAVAVTPATVALPPHSDDTADRAVTCVCRSTEGKPLALTIVEAPGWVSAACGRLPAPVRFSRSRLGWRPTRAGPG